MYNTHNRFRRDNTVDWNLYRLFDRFLDYTGHPNPYLAHYVFMYVFMYVCMYVCTLSIFISPET